jgi:hypothetical protein
MQPGAGHHAAGVTFNLHEGNEGSGFQADGIHGTQHFNTAFRNYYHGWEPGKSAQTNPVYAYAFNRYLNFVGNVLGEPSYHSTYEADSTRAIWNLGDGPGSGIADDAIVARTMLRWGNYDVVTRTAVFNAAEVPSSLTRYANPVPSQVLPASLYLPARPLFWGAMPWPAIGPDVTGGNVPNLGGHVYKIPARACYESLSKNSSGMLLNFNADSCYANGSGAPRSPTNVRIIR